MKNQKFRLVALCAALVLAALAIPGYALPACPVAPCSTPFGICSSFGCSYGFQPQGQCVDANGNVHTYGLVGCSCRNINGQCYI